MVEQSGRLMQLSVLPLIWPSATIPLSALLFNVLGDDPCDLLDPRLGNWAYRLIPQWIIVYTTGEVFQVGLERQDHGIGPKWKELSLGSRPMRIRSKNPE